MGVLRNAEMSGNCRSLVKRHRIVTELPVGMSVGVCGVFFNVFQSVWLFYVKSDPETKSPRKVSWEKNFKKNFLHIFSDHGA